MTDNLRGVLDAARQIEEQIMAGKTSGRMSLDAERTQPYACKNCGLVTGSEFDHHLLTDCIAALRLAIEQMQRLNRDAGELFRAERDDLKVIITAALERDTRHTRFFNFVSAPGKCSGCGAAIFWVVTKNGKRAPFNADAVSHWATCPQAESFRKKK